MKEKRKIRKELSLTPSEFAAFQAAADRAGLPVSTWMVQAAREKLAEESIDKFLYNPPSGAKTEG